MGPTWDTAKQGTTHQCETCCRHMYTVNELCGAEYLVENKAGTSNGSFQTARHTLAEQWDALRS